MLSADLYGLRLRASDKEIIKLEKFVITGGKPLHGEVTISGAKNAAVGVLPATILAADVCVIENLPDISDVAVSLKILSVLGAQIRMINRNTYEIDTTHLTGTNVPDDLSRQMRASYYFPRRTAVPFRQGRGGHARRLQPRPPPHRPAPEGVQRSGRRGQRGLRHDHRPRRRAERCTYLL